MKLRRSRLWQPALRAVSGRAPRCILPEIMWFWAIKVPPQGSGEYGGFLCVPVEADASNRPAKAGLCVFDSEDDARRFIDQQESDPGYEPTPLEHHSITLIVDSEEVDTPERILYIGKYHDGEEIGVEPLSTEEFLRTIEEG